MRRVAVIGLLYLMLMNVVAIVLDNTGFTEEMGVDVSLSASGHLQDAYEAIDSFSLEGGFLETLFGIFNAAYSTMAAVLTGLYAGPEMVEVLGVPPEIIDPFKPILLVIIGLAAIYYASGRSST